MISATSLVNNRFACLSVDEIHDDDSDQSDDSSDAKQTTPVTIRTIRRFRPQWERRLPSSYKISALPGKLSLDIPVEVQSTDTQHRCTLQALVDCGATGVFMHPRFADAHGFTRRKLSAPIPVFNVDGSPNENGSISEVVDLVLRFKDHTERMLFRSHQHRTPGHHPRIHLASEAQPRDRLADEGGDHEPLSVRM